jgi:hypothetical protein
MCSILPPDLHPCDPIALIDLGKTNDIRLTTASSTAETGLGLILLHGEHARNCKRMQENARACTQAWWIFLACLAVNSMISMVSIDSVNSLPRPRRPHKVGTVRCLSIYISRPCPRRMPSEWPDWMREHLFSFMPADRLMTPLHLTHTIHQRPLITKSKQNTQTARWTVNPIVIKTTNCLRGEYCAGSPVTFVQFFILYKALWSPEVRQYVATCITFSNVIFTFEPLHYASS